MIDIKDINLSNIKLLNKRIDLTKEFSKDKVILGTIKEINEELGKEFKDVNEFLNHTLECKTGVRLVLNKDKYRKIKPVALISYELIGEPTEDINFDYFKCTKSTLIKLKNLPSTLLKVNEENKGIVFTNNEDIYLLIR